MSRSIKKGRNKSISLQVVPDVYAKFMSLLEDAGMTRNEGFERIMRDAINAGQIPEPVQFPDEVETVPQTAEAARLQALEQQLRDLQRQVQNQQPQRFTQLPPQQEGQRRLSKRNQTVEAK